MAEEADEIGEPRKSNCVEKGTLVVLTLALFAAGYSAYEAKRLADLTFGTAKSTLRAYVLLESAEIKVQDGAATVRVTIKNGGQTPAFNVTTSCKLETKDEMNRTAGRPAPFPVTGNETTDLGKDSSLDVRQCSEIDLPANGPVQVWGKVNYTDIYGDCQFAAFELKKTKVGVGKFDWSWSSASHPKNTCDDGGDYRKAKWRGPNFPSHENGWD